MNIFVWAAFFLVPRSLWLLGRIYRAYLAIGYKNLLVFRYSPARSGVNFVQKYTLFVYFVVQNQYVWSSFFTKLIMSSRREDTRHLLYVCFTSLLWSARK